MSEDVCCLEMSTVGLQQSKELHERADIMISAWVRDNGYSEAKQTRLLKLFDADCLIRFPVRPGLVRQRTPVGLRFMWYYHAATTIGWKSRSSEAICGGSRTMSTCSSARNGSPTRLEQLPEGARVTPRLQSLPA